MKIIKREVVFFGVIHVSSARNCRD